MSAEDAYNAWAKPHHEGADWAAFSAGYAKGWEAGLREAISICRNLGLVHGMKLAAAIERLLK